jgi:hypothetical protein
VQHIRIDPALSDDEIGNILDHIERNEEHVSSMLTKKVEPGLFGGFTDTSEAHHGKALRLLAENGTLLAKLLGRQIVQAPSPELAGGKVKPQTHADLLAHTQADMHRAVKGDKDAKAKQKTEKAPQTLTEAIFG